MILQVVKPMKRATGAFWVWDKRLRLEDGVGYRHIFPLVDKGELGAVSRRVGECNPRQQQAGPVKNQFHLPDIPAKAFVFRGQ